MARYEDNGDGFLTRGDTLMQYVDNEEHVVIPDGIKRVKSDAFFGCDKMTTLTVPKSVTNIDPYAFTDCDKLEDFIVEEGNPVYRAAGQCIINVKKNTLTVGLRNSVIPDDKSVTVIGGGAFSTNGYDALVIPDGITEIGACAFCGCDFVNLTLPSGVKTIRRSAFAICRKLKTAVLSEGTEIIDDEAFQNCENLRSVTLPESLVSVGEKAFYLCKNLTDLRFPSGLESIGELAFGGCDKWKGELYIPKSLTQIGSNALFSPNCVTSIKVEAGNEKYHAAGNCLIETESKKLVLGCADSVIPDDGSVRVIGFCAFGRCKGLKTIVIPNSVEEIESYAFSDSGLESAALPKDLEKIGSYAFGHKVKLIRK